MMTAEQAAEAAKGLTFEKVWAALMEDWLRMEESRQEWERRMEESRQKWEDRMEESMREWEKRAEESRREMRESRQRVDESDLEWKKRMDESNREWKKQMADLSKNLGGLGNSIGQLTESMFRNELWKKFRNIGIPVTCQSSYKEFRDSNGRVLAEIDIFIENGEYAIAVEVKTKMEIEFVKDHLERIEIVRRYLDERGDKRKLIGAIAGGTVPDNVMKYAHKHGLYVVVQNGDSVSIADAPQGFKAREW